ncbi:MAG: hypothetical protein R2761_13685 [Acidimicrobiales bacterium]
MVSGITVVKHAPAVTSVSQEMTKLAEGQPQVLLAMTNGPACTSAMQEASTTGSTPPLSCGSLPSVCTGADAYMNPAGPAADLALTPVGPGVVSLNDPAHAEDTFVRFAVEQLEAADLDPTRELLGVGFGQYGWAHVEILRIAAMPGGLTRSNSLLALRGADLVHPLVDGASGLTHQRCGRCLFRGRSGLQPLRRQGEGLVPQGAAIDLNVVSGVRMGGASASADSVAAVDRACRRVRLTWVST